MIFSFFTPLLCRLFVVNTGVSRLNISPFPTGTCALCCSIEVDHDIQFQLYTKKNPMRPNILKLGNPRSLRNSNFDPTNPTVIFIHGYAERSSGTSAMAILAAYLKRGEYNVILVDWGKLAALPWYITAVRNTRQVGRHMAKFVKWLDNNNAVPMSMLHVIGFSLGAEAAGFMGKNLAPQKVGRITGLDAAYPLYMDTGMDGHLTATDAAFVDVIHTDGGRFGFPSPIGHADFYPNGGKPLQPGCADIPPLTSRIGQLIRHYVVCSHNRAWEFYAESVQNPRGFPATKCTKWRPEIRMCTWIADAFMGLATHPGNRGIFYLKTNKKPPFARNFTDLNGQYF
ncbi:phospholipase A1 [Diachasmimorpha longicaudata]|uniref:phospholipase A1 n=1 Tax=Diachasmimorpha longicaudata TaxID=58733 RepID=UPI0030B8F5DC